MLNNALRFFFRSSLVVPKALQAFSVCRLAWILEIKAELWLRCGVTTAGGIKTEKAGAKFRCKAVCL